MIYLIIIQILITTLIIIKKNRKKTKASNSSSTNVKKVKLKRKLSEDDLQNPLGKSIDKQIGASSVNRLASSSTILKKSDKKAFSKTIQPTKTSAAFLMNVKVIPNKTKRLEKDKRVKFSLELISKEAFIKLREASRGLFTDEFSKKIFSDDFRKQADSYKDMKQQIR